MIYSTKILEIYPYKIKYRAADYILKDITGIFKLLNNKIVKVDWQERVVKITYVCL